MLLSTLPVFLLKSTPRAHQLPDFLVESGILGGFFLPTQWSPKPELLPKKAEDV